MTKGTKQFQLGRNIDEIQVGDTAEGTEETIELYGQISGDQNPVYS